MPATGNADAPLTEAGRYSAARLGERFESEYGIDPAQTDAAVSYMRRTQESASILGFRKIAAYSELNEISHGINTTAMLGYIARREIPQAGIDAAYALIERPPAEPVWITSAFIITSLCRVLGQHQEARFLPRYGEFRRIRFPSQN